MNVKNLLLKSAMLTFFLLTAIYSRAQDRIFTYTYQSGVLNKGQREIEIWNTYRTGKSDFFTGFDHRTEFEIGLGNNLQTSFYLNLSTQTSAVDNGGIKSLETEHDISFSNEWKYKLLDAVADPVGLALYGELGIGTKENEFEGKVILDKKINKFTLAANAVYELETEAELENNKAKWESEHKAELNVGLAYALSPKFQITTEHAFRNVFAEGELEHSALYSGVGMSYVRDNFWVNFSLMPQVKGFKGSEGKSLNLVEYEKMQYRLLVSFAF
ncbi:MAG: hypothetical protein Q8909_03240 [Bacteroidota bacterium]|nr:hypothetical protein [Bacteroidota bacterium]